MSGRIDSEVAPAPDLRHHGADMRLPGRMKDRLIHFAHDGTEAVHAAHIVDAVHRSPPSGLPGPVYRSRDGFMRLP
jgi:hypothetical protein